MTFWRMQLHPADAESSIKHCVESLAAGYVGLDFEEDVGDLLIQENRQRIPSKHKDFLGFSDEMKPGDHVLIISHHFPFALARVKGEYNFIKHRATELGIWFRHFREVECVYYYADRVTNPKNWEMLTMTDTISPLRNAEKASYRLIDAWLSDVSHI
ncbi:hypothetical protein [Ferrovibrio sp.]|uniref:hypothetical protein n=1 Tax=Ferrovibrio sp. TaxID=1917215 RepID=UPI00261C2091|nr:hypothetical protein [Ferrovibrio sp.]